MTWPTGWTPSYVPPDVPPPRHQRTGDKASKVDTRVPLCEVKGVWAGAAGQRPGGGGIAPGGSPPPNGGPGPLR